MEITKEEKIRIITEKIKTMIWVDNKVFEKKR